MGRKVAMSFAAAALLFSSSPASGEGRVFRDWVVGVTADKEGIFAATVNESGGVFGEYCYPSRKVCYWLLSNDTSCEEGSRYPVLVNTDRGSASTQIACRRVDGKTRYVFASYEEIESSIEGARWLGMAFPMQNGRFQVSRFSLDGAGAAVSFMERSTQTVTTGGSQSTADEVL